MRAFAICVVLAGVVLTGGCSSGESYVKAGFDFARLDTIALVDIQGDIKGETAKNQIGDFFEMELLKKGYSPIERARVQTLLEEQKFRASDVTTTTDAARAGQIINVPTVLMVNIPNFGEETSITAKMIDVETGGILWMASGTGGTRRTLATIFGAGAGAAAGAAVSGEDDKLVGGIAGGVMGGAVGRALSPQKATQAKKIIKKMCKSLPAKLEGQ
jgi:hypothetical protein